MRCPRLALPVAAVACAVAIACTAPPPRKAPVPRGTLALAVKAHGGAGALARLDDLRVRSAVVFRDGVELERELHFVAPSSLAVELSHAGTPVMSFGMSGDRCWQRHRMFVLPCRPEDAAENRRTIEVLRARALHGLAASDVSDAGTVTIDGAEAPSLQAGELRLAFDPESHLLVRVDYEQENARWVELYSAFEVHEDALVAARRVLTIDGRPDVTETWQAIEPGGADPAALRPPEPPAVGSVLEADDAARVVARADLAALDPPAPGEDELVSAARQLGAFLERHGLRASGTDGLVLSWREDGAREAALTAESDRDVDDVREGPFTLTTWPAGHFVGVWVRGDDSSAGALERAVQARGRTAVAGADRQLLLAPGGELEAPAQRLGLVRVAVEP